MLCLKQPNVGASIFNDVASVMYSLKDAKRHWRTYLANIKLIPVGLAASSAQTQPSDRHPSSSGIIFCCLDL